MESQIIDGADRNKLMDPALGNVLRVARPCRSQDDSWGERIVIVSTGHNRFNALPGLGWEADFIVVERCRILESRFTEGFGLFYRGLATAETALHDDTPIHNELLKAPDMANFFGGHRTWYGHFRSRPVLDVNVINGNQKYTANQGQLDAEVLLLYLLYVALPTGLQGTSLWVLDSLPACDTCTFLFGHAKCFLGVQSVFVAHCHVGYLAGKCWGERFDLTKKCAGDQPASAPVQHAALALPTTWRMVARLDLKDFHAWVVFLSTVFFHTSVGFLKQM
eukprot:m.243745 g.243745  ORF g.243745 m.243745 type:complete len:278 (+) comp22553_c3_seq3:463-1296(+)